MYQHHGTSTLPLIAGPFGGLYPLIMEGPGASGWLTSLQLHAQLLSRIAATGIIQHILSRKCLGPERLSHGKCNVEWVNTAKGTQGCDRLCTHHKAGCWHKSLYILIVQGSTVSLVVGHFIFVLQSDVPCAEDTWPHCPKVWMSITVLYSASMVVIEVGPRPRQACLTCRIDTGRV